MILIITRIIVKNSNRYKKFLENAVKLWKSTTENGDWNLSLIEHPDIDTSLFHAYPSSPRFDALNTNTSLSKLRDPLGVFAPVRAAQDKVEESLLANKLIQNNVQSYVYKQLNKKFGLRYFRLYIEEAYKFDPNVYPDFQEHNYYSYIPICLMFDIRDSQNAPLGKV